MRTDSSMRVNHHRRQFIGGSDARIIMGDDEAALLRLWREKRGEAEPEERRLVIAHDDPGIRTADELTTMMVHSHRRISPHSQNLMRIVFYPILGNLHHLQISVK